MTAIAGKGADAFRTISEASAELGVPQHVLRFWETKFSFIKPVKRAGNRRFYRPQDLRVLQGVRTLLHEDGYTIKGVQRLHKEGGIRRLVAAGGGQDPDAEAFTAEFDTAELEAAELEAAKASDAAPAEAVAHAEVGAHDLLAAAARPSEPPAERPSRHVLDKAARSRLSAVLNDLESVKSRIDALLG